MFYYQKIYFLDIKPVNAHQIIQMSDKQCQFLDGQQFASTETNHKMSEIGCYKVCVLSVLYY